MKQPLFSVALAALALTAAVLSSSTSSYADDADSVLGLPTQTGTALTLPGGQPNGPPPTAQQTGTVVTPLTHLITGWCSSYGVPGITNNLAYSFTSYNGQFTWASGSIALSLATDPSAYCAILARAVCTQWPINGYLGSRIIDFIGNTSLQGQHWCGTF